MACKLYTSLGGTITTPSSIIYRMSDFVVFDRLYKRIIFSPLEVAIFQTPEMTRLRRISLTAVPYWLQPLSVCASKFEHSLGVAHLAKICARANNFDKTKTTNLFLACLLHDLGTPPFSHTGEYFQERVFGCNHEEFALRLLNHPQMAQSIKQLGGDINLIGQYIVGQNKPMSDLVNGIIDLDNLDNTLRYGLSMGLIHEQYYNPAILAQALRVSSKKVWFELQTTKELDGWEQCRREVYQLVYSNINLAGGLMLYRALDFAYHNHDLSEQFFFLTDEQAFNYLESACNPKTRHLITMAKQWKFFQEIFSLETTKPSSQLKQFCKDANSRFQISNQLAHYLKIKPESISVYFRQNKAHKDIQTPIKTPTGETLSFSQRSKASYIAKVYIQPNLIELKPAINEYMLTCINQS